MSAPLLRGRLAGRLVLFAAVAPAAAWAIGANWVLALLIAGAAAAAVAALELPARAHEPTWPVPEETRRGGGRREVTSLSWMLTSRHGGTDRAALIRLREIARRRLALQGIDIDAPADTERAIAALGPGAHAILLTEQGAALSHRQIVQCIESLERLDPSSPRDTPPSGPQTGMTRP